MARPRIEPNPENASIRELRETARAGSPETSTRCTAIQLPVCGAARERVCAALLVSERAVSKWIHAFNESGIDGPIGKKRTGRPRKIPPAHTAELADAAEHPGRAGRTVWTGLWFMDESGFEGECRARPRRDRKGRKKRIVRNGGRLRMNAMGAVCPRTGESFALESSHVGGAVFQALLDHAAIKISPKRKRNPLIPGNGSRRKKKAFAGESSNPNIFRPARRTSIPSNASGS